MGCPAIKYHSEQPHLSFVKGGMFEVRKRANPYRFGFNGQEKDDEVSGSGNSNTAEYWQYDTRLGRRWNIDPVVISFLSPYSTFANNPIFYNDVNGDTFVGEKGEVEKLKTEATDRLNETNKEISNLQAKIDERIAKGKKAKDSQISHLEALTQSKNELVGLLNEIDVMEKSTQIYNIITTDPLTNGGVDYDPSTKYIDISFSKGNTSQDMDFGSLAHELKHGYQFEEGKLSFFTAGGNPGVLYDMQDEVEAYKRQYVFHSNGFSSYNAITPEVILATFGDVYKNVYKSTSNIKMDDIVTEEVLKYYFTDFDRSYIGKTYREFFKLTNKQAQREIGRDFQTFKK